MAAGARIRFRREILCKLLGWKVHPEGMGSWSQRKNSQSELLCTKHLGVGKTKQTGPVGEHLVGQYRRNLKIF